MLEQLQSSEECHGDCEEQQTAEAEHTGVSKAQDFAQHEVLLLGLAFDSCVSTESFGHQEVTSSLEH